LASVIPSPLPDSPETARLRTRLRRVRGAFGLNAGIWGISCAAGWLLDALGRDDIGSSYIVWIVLTTTPLLFVGIFVVRRFERTLGLHVRRELAGRVRTADWHPTAAAPVIPSPKPADSPEAARLRVRHRRHARALAAIGIVWLASYLFMAAETGGPYPFLVFLLAILVGGVEFLVVSRIAAALTRQTQQDAEEHREPVAAEAGRAPAAPVLYLRSFADDRRASRRYGALTEEEQLARALAWIGPLMAVGRPGEQLPEVGAQRIYLADGDWQARVTELMAQAALVVLRTGSTEGFRWEVMKALGTVAPERLLLVADSRRELRQVLDMIARRVGRSPVRVRFPGRAIGSVKGLVTFDANWSPRPLRLVRAPFRVREADERLRGRFTLALQPLFERQGVSCQLPRLSPLRIFWAVFLIGAAIIIPAADYYEDHYLRPAPAAATAPAAPP
jgi:hypothetical protein